jgi:hypothetical protein
MSPHLRLSFVAVAALGAAVRAAEPAPSGRSPFSPPASAASTAAAAASETLEFAGVSAMGNRTDVILFDKTARKSHLITAGETVAGISVLNYDARRDQVVIRVNGQQKTLTLRKSSAPTGGVPPAAAPMPVGFNVPPPAPPPVAVGSTTGVIPPAPAPEVAPPPAAAPAATAAAPASPAQQLQTKQETEARMLVSDLLEIGMAQRRAYEEAQRKAAEANVQKP